MTKTKFNRAIKELKCLLDSDRDRGIQKYLSKLSASAESNCSLWKATKKLKSPQQRHPPIKKQNGSWARSDKEKAETLATHLSRVFKPNPREITLEEENKLLSEPVTATTTTSLDTPTKPFTSKEVRTAIKNLNPKKAPGYDLITNRILQMMPDKAIKFITQICNAVLKRASFPLNEKWPKSL